ncbi:LysE family translocator [Nocardiopsis aegyptia]
MCGGRSPWASTLPRPPPWSSPDHLYLLARAAAGGPRAGALSTPGVETGTLVHTAAAAFGLSSLPAASSTAHDLVRHLGPGYLVHLGVRTLTSKDTHHHDQAPAGLSSARAFTDGLLVNVLNPEVALFVDPAQGPATAHILTLGLIMVALEPGHRPGPPRHPHPAHPAPGPLCRRRRPPDPGRRDGTHRPPPTRPRPLPHTPPHIADNAHYVKLNGNRGPPRPHKPPPTGNPI